MSTAADEVIEIMHERALPSEMSQSDALDFYDEIAYAAKTSADAIREEIGDD